MSNLAISFIFTILSAPMLSCKQAIASIFSIIIHIKYPFLVDIFGPIVIPFCDQSKLYSPILHSVRKCANSVGEIVVMWEARDLCCGLLHLTEALDRHL